jgi:phage-related minor tail protein
MAKRIQGIVISLDGETKGLDKALNDVNKRSRDLQGELRDVERLLKFSPDNVEALAQKQKLLTEQVENTSDKLNQLKKAQSQVEEQFKKGDIGEKQYRSFRREIEFTETELNKFKKKLDSVDDGNSVKNLKKDFDGVEKKAGEAKKAVSDLGSEIGGLAGGLVAGGGIAGIIGKALEMSSLKTKIDIQFNVPDESKESVKDAVKGIEAYGLDAEEALEGVRRQWALNKDATDNVNLSISKGAGAIAASFSGVDFTELIQETNEIASGLDISNQNALALVDALLKAGFPPEQLDTIAEYGQQMKDAGFSAAEIQKIFEAGIDTKTWNIDNLNDGVKEARIQMAAFGEDVPDAISDLLEGTKVSADQWNEWGKAVAKGGSDGSKAMGEVVTFLDSIEDKAKKNALATKVFGTKWEDQGQNMITIFQGVADSVDKTTENTNGLYETMGNLNSDPAVEFQQALTRMNEALQPILTKVVEFITKIAEWVAENPKLAATITAIVTAMGILMGIMLALAPIITAIIGLSATLGIGLLPLTGIIGLVIAAIAALIAYGVLLYKNWDTIKEYVGKVWAAMVVDIGNYMRMVQDVIQIVWNYIKTTFINALKLIKAILTGDFEGMKEAVSDQMDNIKNTIEKIWNRVMSFLENIELIEVGKDIIRGMVDGIKSMGKKLLKSVTGVVDDAIQGAKKLLGIASPSKVFKQFGVYTGEGFEIGMKSQIGAISRASDKMVEASLPSIPRMDHPSMNISGNSSSTPQTSTMNFEGMFKGANFHVRNDNDIHKLAQELARYVNRNKGRAGLA